MEIYDLFNAEHWIRHLRGGVHFTAAMTALLLGPTVLGRAKGTPAHRLLGRIWVALMLALNLSALTMYGLDGRPNLFHAFALLSLWALIPGFLAIRRYTATKDRKDLVAHKVCMHWAYFGLVAAGVWQVASRIAVLSESAEFNNALWILGLLTVIASWAFNRWLVAMSTAVHSQPPTHAL